MTRRLLLALLGTALVASACERRPTAVAPASSAPRVAVMTPALAATLRWLGLGDVIVARHGYDQWSDQSLPVCGDQSGFDYEKLLSVKPTDILIEWGDRPLPERLTALAKERGWRIHNFSTLTLEQVAKTADELNALFTPKSEHSAGDEPPVKPSEKLRAAWSKRSGPDLTRAGRVLLLVPGSPDSALGPGSAHAQILERLGGRPAVGAGGPYQSMDAEDILKLDPGVIVLIVPRAPGAATLPGGEAQILELLGPLAKLDLRAVKGKRVAVFDDSQGLLPSASALVTFADKLHETLAGWSDSAPAPAPGAP